MKGLLVYGDHHLKQDALTCPMQRMTAKTIVKVGIRMIESRLEVEYVFVVVEIGEKRWLVVVVEDEDGR
jgi:hypothetical protein